MRLCQALAVAALGVSRRAIPTDSQLKEKQEQQDPSAPPLLPRQPKLPGPIHPTSPDDTDLVELVGKVLETAEGVAAAVEEGREGVEQETELTRQESVEGSSSDIYMKAMKPLQFGKSGRLGSLHSCS